MASHAQDAATGERLFRQRCMACHAVQAGPSGMGPHLKGIVGRRAGSVEGARYSRAMQEDGQTWDAARLERYLANPQAVVRGTTMPMAVPDAGDRASLVAYLRSLGTEP